MRRIDTIIVHHNGVDGRTWRNILASHLGNGWATIGYHRVIHEDGSVHQGRADLKPGAHAGKRWNARSLGICLIGNLNKRMMHDAQRDALVRLLADLCAAHDLDPLSDVIGHRETGATKKACPGTRVDMNLVRDAVAAEMQRRRG